MYVFILHIGYNTIEDVPTISKIYNYFNNRKPDILNRFNVHNLNLL